MLEVMPDLTPKQKRAKRVANVVQNGELAILEEIFNLEETLQGAIQEIGEKYPHNMEEILASMQGDDGEDGGQGPQGDDGEDGEQGEMGPAGRDGVNGTNGRDGRDGRDGLDGNNGLAGPAGTDGRDGSPDTAEQVVEKVNISRVKIAASQVAGLDDIFRNVRENQVAVPVTTAFYNGLRAKNLTIVGATAVQNGDTVLVTPASTSGGTFAVMQPTGAVNGSNTAFTFTSAPSVIVVDQGRTMQKVSSDGTINWTGTTNVTLTLAPNYDIFGY